MEITLIYSTEYIMLPGWVHLKNTAILLAKSGLNSTPHSDSFHGARFIPVPFFARLYTMTHSQCTRAAYL